LFVIFCNTKGLPGDATVLGLLRRVFFLGADIYRIVGGAAPGYQPTRKPTGSGSGGECVDDPTWCYGDCSPNDCAYVAQKVKPDGTLARCKEKNTDGERSALEACPATCGTCP